MQQLLLQRVRKRQIVNIFRTVEEPFELLTAEVVGDVQGVVDAHGVIHSDGVVGHGLALHIHGVAVLGRECPYEDEKQEGEGKVSNHGAA